MPGVAYECIECEVQGFGKECWIDPSHTIKKLAHLTIAYTMHNGLTHEQLTFDPDEQRD